MKRVLVTGANGFIGRQCLPLLLAKGYEVHAVSRYEVEPSLPVIWHNSDLLSPGSPVRLVAKIEPEYLLSRGMQFRGNSGNRRRIPSGCARASTCFMRSKIVAGEGSRRPAAALNTSATLANVTKKRLHYCPLRCTGARSMCWKRSFTPVAIGAV
jgi:hypothetical protein